MAQPGTEVDLDTSLGYLVKQAASALRTAMEAVLRPLGLTVTEYSCLELLRQRPGLSNSALARGAFVTRQSMNVLLQALAADGLVVRPDTPPTGRVLPTTLTEQGCARLERASLAVRQVEQSMVADLAQHQQAELRRMLAACADALTPTPS